MVVFTHKCLPLTSNTKEPKSINASVEEQQDVFHLVLQTLKNSVKLGLPLTEEIEWDYDYTSLWSPRLSDSRTGRKINIWKCSQDTYIGVLSTRTYWYKRLPKSGKMRVKALAANTKGRRFMKDVLDTCDGVLTSLIFSFPEMFLEQGGYALSDRMTNSIIMNCFHNYSRFQKNLKLLRKTVKHAALNFTKVTLGEEFIRDMSYFAAPIKWINRTISRTSKEKFFRIAMLCQTRATGLVGVAQINEALEKFISTVTVKRDFKPSQLTLECIDEVTSHLAGSLNYGFNSEFKVSMSTSACRESGRKTEGKFGFLKNLVRDSEITIPPLRDGVQGTLGNWLWPEAIGKIESGDKEVLKVNVAAIRENGKARIVTSGSFWKDAALQPFSHISLNVAKLSPNLKDSLRASRHGWKFIEQVKQVYADNEYGFVFDKEEETYLYTTDMERATDLPTPEMGRLVTGGLLRKMGFPDEVLKPVLDYWVGPKELYVGGKHVGTLVNGIPMGDPLTKTNLSLTHPICDLYARKRAGCISKQKGNGDDVSGLSTSKYYAKFYRECGEQLGYEFSELDECNSTTWGTYCEEWFHVPVSRANTCHLGMKHKNQMLLPYIDTPKIRVMIATCKDRIDFSSDPRGKVTLLGHDEEYARKMEGPAEAIYSIASAFQDVSLYTIDRPEPLFLPRQIVGVGKPPPHWNVNSWMNIMNKCKPWHRNYYLTMMKEFTEGTQSLSGYRGAMKESNHFSKEMMVEYYEIPEDDPIREEILVKSDQWSLFPGMVLSKLVGLGYLVPESKLAKYYLFQERLEQLEQDTKRDLFQVIRAKMVECDYDEADALSIISKFKDMYADSPYRINSDRTENLYNINAVLRLEDGNPLYVDLPPDIQNKFRRIPHPLTKYEECGVELYEWFMSNGYNITTGDEYELPPTDLLEDDPIIVQEVLNGGHDNFFIVTEDIKLYRLCANKANVPVGRISCYDFLSAMLFYGEERLEPLENEICELMRADCRIIVDRGSLNSFLEKYHTNDEGSFVSSGIPWQRDVKPENMQKVPGRGTIQDLKIVNLSDNGYPRKAFPQGYPSLFKRR
jgi:hypothetical protein